MLLRMHYQLLSLRDINIISGTTKRDAMSAWMKKLPAKQDDLAINNGKWIAPRWYGIYQGVRRYILQGRWS